MTERLLEERRRRLQTNNGYSYFWSILWTILGLVAIAALIMAIILMVWNSDNIKRISGVGPVNYEVFTVAGAGINVNPDPPTHKVTFSNTGVLSVNGKAGDVTVTNGAGISVVTSDPATVTIANTGVLSANTQTGAVTWTAGDGVLVSTTPGDIKIDNTGVLSANTQTGAVTWTAGTGIQVNTAANDIQIVNTGLLSVVAENGVYQSTTAGVSTIKYVLNRDTALDDTNALGPQIRFTASLNDTQDAWMVATFTAVDDGQGNTGGTGWAVPEGAVGLYAVNAHCVLTSDGENYTAIHGALTLGATTADPTVDGHLPAGGRTSIVGTPLGPLTTLGMSAMFHAGCTGCPVQGGDALKLHAYMTTNDFGDTLLMDCQVFVSKII